MLTEIIVVSAISMAKCNYGTRYIIVGYRVEISPFSVIIMCNVSDMVVALNGTAKVSFQSMQPTKWLFCSCRTWYDSGRLC